MNKKRRAVPYNVTIRGEKTQVDAKSPVNAVHLAAKKLGVSKPKFDKINSEWVKTTVIPVNVKVSKMGKMKNESSGD